MTNAPFAKALTKHSYQLGLPPKLIIPVYSVAIMIAIISKLYLWEFLIVAVVWHFYAKLKFDKDEYFIAYFFDSLISKEHLEP